MAYPASTEAVETRRKPDNTKHVIVPEIGPTCQQKPGVVTRRKEKRNQVLGTRNPGKEKDGTGNQGKENCGTRNREHGTGKTEPGTRKTEPGTRNREDGRRNPEPGTRC
jgi:hypothetical protein